jgi:EamA domain-containing membrane protein RarD
MNTLGLITVGVLVSYALYIILRRIIEVKKIERDMRDD